MSTPTSGFAKDRQPGGAQAPVGIDYIPTDEERLVFSECNRESFWYRSVPFAVVSMGITQVLMSRGILSGSPRFGPGPKIVFAGFCGYLGGKLSYMKECQEKFKRLENSPLGEALKQRTGLPPQYSKGPQSELSDPDTQSFDSMFQPAESQSQIPAYNKDYGYNPEPQMQMERENDFNVPAQVEEEEPRRKPILYEDLRLKNRENYEVMLTQKAETPLKPQPQRESERPHKEVKKNIYGDAWEE